MDRCGIFAEVPVEFHEVDPVGLARNTGEYRVGEAIRDGFDSENNDVCWCRAWTRLLSASTIYMQ